MKDDKEELQQQIFLRRQMLLDKLNFKVYVGPVELFPRKILLDPDNADVVLIDCSDTELPEPEIIDIEFNEVATQAEPKKRGRKAAGRSTRR